MSVLPWPVPDDDTAPFWSAVSDRRLLVQSCDACGHRQLYPRVMCTRCSALDVAWEDSGGRGTIYSFTVSRRASHPVFEDRVPYVVALVDLDEGPRLLSNVVGAAPEEIRIGAEVEVTFVEMSEGVVLPMFELSGRSEGVDD